MKGGESTGIALDFSGMNMSGFSDPGISSSLSDTSALANLTFDTPVIDTPTNVSVSNFSQPTSSYGAFSEVPSYTQQTGRDLPSDIGTPFGQAQDTNIFSDLPRTSATSGSFSQSYVGTPFGQAASSLSTTTYTVQPGDTLSQIAKDAGITLQELKDLNPKFDTDPKYQGGNMIWSGTTVKLPGQNIVPPIVQQPTEPPPPAEPSGGMTTDTIIYNYVPPTPPAPTVEAVVVSSPPTQIKTAQPDIIIFDEEVIPAEIMADLVLENIGGHELINIARYDTINGQNIVYQPIKDLSLVQQKNNSNNIINLQQTSNQYFSGFPIDLSSKIPEENTQNEGRNFYVNIFGDLIIEMINLREDERVEVEIIQSSDLYNWGIE